MTFRSTRGHRPARRGMALLLGLALLWSLGGCQKGAPHSPPAGAPIPITVAYTVQPQSTLVHVALARGYFAAEGLDATAQVHDFGKSALQAVLDRKADFATVADTPIMFSILAGEKIAVLANIEASSQNNGIVANTTAGIHAPKDLKGKRVGFTAGTTSDFFLDTFLTANALQRSDIHALALTPDAMRTAIASKRVDAVSTWNYTLAQVATDLGDQGVTFFDRDIFTETFNIVVQHDYLQSHPEAAKRFLRALVRAEEYVANHPDDAQGIVARATQTDRAVVRHVWNDFNYRVQHGEALVLTLEDETRWAMAQHLTRQTQMPDYRSYLDLNSLQGVKPDALSAHP